MIPELNKIYQGDCVEVMRSWPDKCVDLIVTDPPYGMNYLSNYYKNGNPHKRIIGDNSFPTETLLEMMRLARRAVFCFCRWNNIKEMPEPKSLIVWAKNNWTAGDLEHEYGRQWEACAFYPQKDHEFIMRPSDVLDFRRIPSNDLLHPTEKPVSLMCALISKNKGEIVLDPFCGSGSTLLAAEREGRKWIGIEIEPEYVKIAEERVRRERNQLKLL